MANQSWRLDRWRFQHLVRGYLWTSDNPAAQFRCLLIIWCGDGETWDAAAVLHGCGARISRTFESNHSAVAGLNLCFGWLRGFVGEHDLAPPEVLGAWARLLGDASAEMSDEVHRHSSIRLN
jgi:hypothetical protein